MDYTLLLAELVTAVKEITSAGGSMTGAEILAAMLDVDGAGSGLDADTLDGQHASDFALAGSVPSAETAASILTKLLTVDGAGSGLDADTLDGIQGSDYLPRGEAYQNFYSDPTSVLAAIKQVDGAGSGLDADLLDGNQASAFLQTGQPIDATTLEGHASGDFEPAGATSPANVMAAIKQVDGAGSGLDADLLDGKHASEFSKITMFNGRVPVPTFLNATKNNGDYTIDFSGIVPDSATAVVLFLQFTDTLQPGDVIKYCGFCGLKSYTTDNNAQDSYMLMDKQYITGRATASQGILALDGQNRATVTYACTDNGYGKLSVFVLGYYN